MAETLLVKSGRRKSFSFFHSHQLSSSSTSTSTSTSAAASSLTHDRSSSDGLSSLKRARRNSSFFGSRDPSPKGTSPNVLRRPQTSESEVMFGAPDPLKQKRKSLQPSKRSSVFGSFRSLQSFEDDERLTGQRSRGPSIDDSYNTDITNLSSTHTRRLLGHVVLHHGEVQTAGTMWRKRNHYLVLTDTHLIRFKSQHKAADLFPTITVPSARPTPVSRQSVVSVASVQDHSVSAHGDVAAIALNSIVSVNGLEEGRNQTTIELSYLDDRTNKAALMAIQLTDPEEQNLWLIGIRAAAQSTRTAEPLSFENKAVEYVVRVLEQDRDYDPENFNMFRVVQRSAKQNLRTSADDLGKLSATMCYLAIGLHKIHLIPLQKGSSRSSLISMSELDLGSSLGLMSLTFLMVHSGDDRFQLTFR
jgi:hypothetical protein